jgi:hypothetical protein
MESEYMGGVIGPRKVRKERKALEIPALSPFILGSALSGSVHQKLAVLKS